MKKLLLAGISFAALSAGPALAADLAPPVYRAAPVMGASWTGLYAGLNIGGSIGLDDSTQAATFASPALGANGLLSSSNRFAPTGGLLGGQLGYNYQIANYVVGVEADWQWTRQKDNQSNCTPFATLNFWLAGANGFTYCTTSEQKLTNFGTARGRGGILINNVLWYATGGLAWGTTKDSYAFSSANNPAVFGFAASPFAGAASFSNNRMGWSVGAGLEMRVAGPLSLKLEYLYVDLGSINEAFPLAINPAFAPFGFIPGAAGMLTSTHITDNVIRVGVNYKLGG
jgi:outer membrane immunogenic protein